MANNEGIDCAEHKLVKAIYAAVGKIIVKVVPFPTRLSTVILPRCDSTTALTIERPSPVPPYARERDFSTR